MLTTDGEKGGKTCHEDFGPEKASEIQMPREISSACFQGRMVCIPT